jgi:hypothetical protein
MAPHKVGRWKKRRRMTPEEAKRRHDEWYAKRAEWVQAMVDAGFRVKLKRLGKGKHPAPAALPVDPEPG